MYILATIALAAVLWVLLAPGGAEKAEAMYDGLRGRLKFRTDTRELSNAFRQWATEASASKRAEQVGAAAASSDGFARWLSSLSDDEQDAFTRQVARFCASVGFDLGWLSSADVAREPELKKAVEDTVLLYSLAVWRARRVEGEVRSFLAYQAWVAKPKRHRAFGQKLHRALVERKLITVPAELYLASEEDRAKQAFEAITALAESNRDAFNEVLRNLEAQPAAQPEAAPAAQAKAAPASTTTTTPAAKPAAAKGATSPSPA